MVKLPVLSAVAAVAPAGVASCAKAAEGRMKAASAPASITVFVFKAYAVMEYLPLNAASAAFGPAGASERQPRDGGLVP
ncbi:hypothetical protein Sa4125_03810 [Aureimonas sp. SA4125]|nr:hypothetical protein Sa4125_03810 [Aureimonas sp. SA4125]